MYARMFCRLSSTARCPPIAMVFLCGGHSKVGGHFRCPPQIALPTFLHKSLSSFCYNGGVIACQKPPKGGVGFAWKNCWVSPPPVTALTSKCHNFFSIGSLLSLEMYVRQKFSLCLFSLKNFDFVCFPPFLNVFFFA